jgi:MoxR-like ATPase
MVNKLHEAQVKKYKEDLENIQKEVSKLVVGQEEVIFSCLRAILANGHILIEGLPGTAKTLLVRALASATGCSFNRIQFTVDLLPADIVGITVYDKLKGFYTIKGPIFSHFVIADEINRAPPKTQSALLEAMQEKQVTISKQTYPLDEPFFVMATQNPIESAGVYNLPEAQLDRFMFKIQIRYPSNLAEKQILKHNVSMYKYEDFEIKPMLNPKKIIEMQKFVKETIFLDPKVEDYILKIVDATRYPDKYGLKSKNYIAYGVSPRASIALYIAAKADALIQGHSYVGPQNVKNVAFDILRHRILLNYEAQADDIKTEDVVKEILSKVPVP